MFFSFSSIGAAANWLGDRRQLDGMSSTPSNFFSWLLFQLRSKLRLKSFFGVRYCCQFLVKRRSSSSFYAHRKRFLNVTVKKTPNTTNYWFREMEKSIQRYWNIYNLCKNGLIQYYNNPPWSWTPLGLYSFQPLDHQASGLFLVFNLSSEIRTLTRYH